MTTRDEWLARRIEALETLLAYYRIGRQPSEKLFTELDRTRAALPDLYKETDHYMPADPPGGETP